MPCQRTFQVCLNACTKSNVEAIYWSRVSLLSSITILDDGSCLIIYGPHVGVATSGGVGKVERAGIELVDNCCGSAIAASNYLQGICEGGAAPTTKIQEFTDFQQVCRDDTFRIDKSCAQNRLNFQRWNIFVFVLVLSFLFCSYFANLFRMFQGAVQELILPHGKRLTEAGDDRMRELPFCLYESQDALMQKIVEKGCGGVKNNIALLGGIQINTAPEALDYFLPLRFDFMNNKGEVMEDMLEKITYI